MKYFELTFSITPNDEAAGDVLAALLAEAGCEAFVPTETGLKAYAQQALLDEEAVRHAIADFPLPCSITYDRTEAPDENWNATWEDEHHFLPIDLPSGKQLHILPRQAFGSGEHQTTRMMLSLLGTLPLNGSYVIDAGCGTGILALAALKLGAQHVCAYDIDEWSIRNTADNAATNDIEAARLTLLLGDASVLADAPEADVLTANINLNILLADLPAFARHLRAGGHLLLSGFLADDTSILTRQAETLGFCLQDTVADGDWRALHLIKS